MIAIGAMTVASVYFLRRRHGGKDLYRAPPGAALLFLVVAAFVCGAMIWGAITEGELEPLYGLAILPAAWVFGFIRDKQSGV